MTTIWHSRRVVLLALVVGAALAALLAVSLVRAQPNIPHDPTQGGGACTMCHSVGGSGVGETGGTGLPASHEGRTDDACTMCHSAAAAETPTPEPTAAPTDVPADTAAPTDVPADTAAPTDAPTDTSTLTSAAVPQAPVLDGTVDALWDDATEISIPVAGGVNMGSTTVLLRSVYTADSIYFLLNWADPTESLQRFPWVKQADGGWLKLTTETDHQENTYYEDKAGMIWDINIAGFAESGCATLCHAGEQPAGSGYGNKYAANPGEIGDTWHWKSVRTNPVGQADDKYVNSDRYDGDNSAGRHSDPKEGGGYANSENEDKTLPAFTAPDQPAPPYWILDTEKQPFEDTYEVGDEIASIIVSPFIGDRGDVSAKGVYRDGQWFLEIGRKLTTGSDVDIQFSDLSKPYYFAVSVFDNSQVNHAYQTGSTKLVFAVADGLPPTGGSPASGGSSSSDWLIVVGVAIAGFAILGSAGYLRARRRHS